MSFENPNEMSGAPEEAGIDAQPVDRLELDARNKEKLAEILGGHYDDHEIPDIMSYISLEKVDDLIKEHAPKIEAAEGWQKLNLRQDFIDTLRKLAETPKEY